MHRSSNHPIRAWLAPGVGVLAIAAFPMVASAATGPLPTPTPPCASPPVGNSPCYTVAPAISPSNEWPAAPPEGRTLSATTGTWSGTPAPSLTYQWYDCTTSATTSCTPIATATSRTYTVASTDVPDYLALVVKASGAGTGYAVLESTGPATTAVPINRGAPVLSGNAQDGQTLMGSNGMWAGTMPITLYTYQWDRCNAAGLACAKITTATTSSYGLTDADVGHTVELGVEATNSVGTAGATTCAGTSPCPVFSTATALVTPGNAAAPTISGTAAQGKTLTETHGAWLPASPASYLYQWEDCDTSGANCSPIPGATSQSYMVGTADAGHTMVVQEAATYAGATSSPVSSAPTGVVPQPVSGNTGGSQGASQNGSQNGTQGGGQGGSGPAPTGSSTAPAAVTVAQLRGMLDNALAVHGGGGRISAVVKRGGYSFTFSAPSAGTLAVSWYRRLHGRTVLIAKATVRIHTSGKVKVELVLTSKGRKLLKGAGKTTLTAQAGFTPVGHSTTSTSTTITLKK